MKPNRLARYYYLRFLRLQGDPGSLARGTALGVFNGLAPIIPFHTIFTLLVVPLARGNLIAAFLASFLTCNPLTYVPQYYFSWLIGTTVTPYDLSWERIQAMMDMVFSDISLQQKLLSLTDLGLETAVVLLVGGFLFSAPFAVISYFLSLRFFIAVQEKRRQKHILS